MSETDFRSLGESKFQADAKELLHAIRMGDVDQAFPESVLRIERSDFWGRVFFEQGGAYSRFFEGITPIEAFRTLSSFLYPDAPGSSSVADVCSPLEQVSEVANDVHMALKLGVAEADDRPMRTAFVLVAMGNTRAWLNSLRRVVHQFTSRFNHRYNYPLILLTDDASRFHYLAFETRTRIHFAEIDPEQFAPRLEDGSLWSEANNPRGFPEDSVYHVRYRQMQRYLAYSMIQHPVLAQFDYILLMDPLAFVNTYWRRDVFAALSGKVFGFMKDHEDLVPESAASRAFQSAAMQYVASHGGRVASPGLIDKAADGRWPGATYHGAVIALSTSFFRRKEFADAYHHFNRAGGFFSHGWSAFSLWKLFVAVHANAEDVLALEGPGRR